MKITATRYHDISAGHRVYGHESKCSHLHGHNYRIHLTVEGVLDSVGRVLDFSIIKTRFFNWIEDQWDHKFLVYEEDTLAKGLRSTDPLGVVLVPFNPTAENMASYLVEKLNSMCETEVKVIECRIEETRKCSATAKL